ncbi:uncharacterized protein PGTG_10098 [Puccinia graminis f. sp. tritici CRL 75-36-700-3]|uniref:DUF7143 domain-containing protein n=1 Tax=Puccinia graminis f. sp. tritici (strain CRL 75-36-700-3 / race SCCL) TaxID=418459 RepID=E3KJA3_PUCGT|nr:uncharacterized protein PGTG_10098 [Puccinia graminis f. sp. tritici CRL 75-36-700-3]EFP84378.2 hypothetical protein PGTG_10098 [Puccinia graminis f. sp. tritici CRL 75-36-700-3]
MIETMLNLKNSRLILILVLQFLAPIVRTQSLCYIPNEAFDLPSDVKPPADVTCGSGTILGKIPDLIFSGRKFSEIDFTKSKLTPGGFALANFQFGGKNTQESLIISGKLYTAANAALRARGDRKILNRLKVVDFFITSQIDKSKGKEAKDSLLKHLGKVLKNCGKPKPKGNCNQGDVDKINAMVIEAKAL